MKILSPINKPKEVEGIIQAGADELYCGILPEDWKELYTNVASPNRREWKAANLTSFSELKEVTDIAHSNNTPVFLTLNALYTKNQYPLILNQVEQSKKIGVDALIIADLGLLLTLKRNKINMDIHISTGGTTFNSQTAKFYEELGASRIILPRHLQIQEIEQIVKSCPSLKFEIFILNSGCKNIDGFCTFQHGVKEIIHRRIWDVPKKLNFDRYFLNIIRCLPRKFAEAIRVDVFGIDSACLLNYDIFLASESSNIKKRRKQDILKNISSGFSLISGVDTCGVCRLLELTNMGVYGVKAVGRNYSTVKKIKDARFLKAMLSCIEKNNPGKDEFYSLAKKTFKRIYGINCANLCYYPDGM